RLAPRARGAGGDPRAPGRRRRSGAQDRASRPARRARPAPDPFPSERRRALPLLGRGRAVAPATPRARPGNPRARRRQRRPDRGRRRGADRTALLAPLDPRRTRPELGAQRPRARDLRPRLRPRARVPPVPRPLAPALGDDVRAAAAPRDPAGALLRRRAGAPPHATP